MKWRSRPRTSSPKKVEAVLAGERTPNEAGRIIGLSGDDDGDD